MSKRDELKAQMARDMGKVYDPATGALRSMTADEQRAAHREALDRSMTRDARRASDTKALATKDQVEYVQRILGLSPEKAQQWIEKHPGAVQRALGKVELESSGENAFEKAQKFLADQQKREQEARDAHAKAVEAAQAALSARQRAAGLGLDGTPEGDGGRE